MPNPVTCTGCNMERTDVTPEDLASGRRPPCPNCGATTVRHGVHLAATATMRADVSTELTPGDQSRGWRRRWTEINRDLAQLSEPRKGEYSAEGIHAAQQDLQSFYINAYHLKDALKREAATTKVPKQAVEDAISKTPDLALLCDLANLDKHGHLNEPPRSGDAPTIVRVAGRSPAGPQGGWQLVLEIEHKGKRRDGLDFARQALEAWRLQLQNWKLV